jgi:hypothetical protein
LTESYASALTLLPFSLPLRVGRVVIEDEDEEEASSSVRKFLFVSFD